MGRRGVSSEELYRLARIYATTLGALLGEEAPGEQEALRVLFRGDGGTPAGRAAAQRFLARCRAERELEDLLETKLDAIRQGERVAAEERRRLDLGSEPIRNIFELIEAQQIHLCPLEDAGDLEVDGLYLETQDLGACIAVNPARDFGTGFRSAFTAAHEFAHWVLRDVMVEAFTLGPTEDLREVRAMDRFGVSRTALLYRLQNISLLGADAAEPMRGEEPNIFQTARALGLHLRRDWYDAGRLPQLAVEAWRRGLVSTGRERI